MYKSLPAWSVLGVKEQKRNIISGSIKGFKKDLGVLCNPLPF